MYAVYSTSTLRYVVAVAAVVVVIVGWLVV